MFSLQTNVHPRKMFILPVTRRLVSRLNSSTMLILRNFHALDFADLRNDVKQSIPRSSNGLDYIQYLKVPTLP